MNDVEKIKERSLETINWESLKLFIKMYAYSIVGEYRDRETTLIEEISLIGKLIYRASVKEINFYSNKAFDSVEFTTEERVKRAARAFKQATNKIMWLNTVCEQMTGSKFIKEFISKSDAAATNKLVDAFDFCIKNADLI